MKLGFSDILTKLSSSATKTSDIFGSELLEAEISAKVHESLRNQLNYMKYYREDSESDPISDSVLKKIDVRATLLN